MGRDRLERHRGHAPSAGIEAGQVLFLPELRSRAEPREAVLFTPAILGSSKNASFDPATGRLGGTNASGDDAELLRALMRRFSDAAAALVNTLLPDYRATIARGRASFRPAEIAGRASSWRKDDTRLHVDSFPATPTGGRRILRVFSNVNPNGKPRAWRVGGDFESVARRFANTLSIPLPGSGHLLALLRVTKSPRSAYDALMLQLHDRMKGDEDVPARLAASGDRFSGGLDVAGVHRRSEPRRARRDSTSSNRPSCCQSLRCNDPERSPLRVLERLKGRRLA